MALAFGSSPSQHTSRGISIDACKVEVGYGHFNPSLALYAVNMARVSALCAKLDIAT
jgi:hypothetical protein